VRGPVLLEGPDGGGKITLAEAIAVPSESAMKRLAARDPEREEQLRAVHEDYRRVAQFSSGPHAYHYDRTRPRALEEMVATLKERLDP
jgi:hypothetical protein